MNPTLQPIIDTLIPLLPGWLELPESYVGLLKSASHKYVRRVPKAGGGYRYFYHVGHGGGINNEDHFVPGAAFRFEGGHYHIKSEDGGKLVIEHDETKERKTVSKSELRQMLGAHHEPAIKAHREKVAGMLAEARANKASPKQIAKLEARAKVIGATPKAGAKDEKDGHRPTHVGFSPGESNFEYVSRNDDGTIRVRNDRGDEFDLTKQESDAAHLSYAPSTSGQDQHINPRKMSRTDYIRAEIGQLKARRAARVRDAEAAIADLVKIKLPVGIGPVQYLQSKSRPTKQESAALVSHRVAEKALKMDYNGDTYHFGRVWDMAHGKKDDHPGFSYGKD